MAVTSQAAETQSVLHVVRPGRRARAFVLGTSLGVVLVLGAMIGIRQLYAGRILPGTLVGSVAVGGLTSADARAALVSTFGHIESGRITVRSSAGSVLIPFSSVGRTIDVDGLVAQAMALGRDRTRFDEIVAGARQMLQPISLEPLVRYDRAGLQAALASYAATAYAPAVDASVQRTATGFVVNPSTAGARIDTDRALAALDTALTNLATPASIDVSADVTSSAPAISDSDAERSRSQAARMATDLQLVKGTGKWKIPAARIRSWIAFAGSGPNYAPYVDTSAIPKAFKAVAKGVRIPAGEATFLRDRAGRIFGVSASHDGRALDVGATTTAIVQALATRAAGGGPALPVVVRTHVVGPKFTTSQATTKAPLMQKVGSWTTFYDVAAHNGFGANITVPARRLNGLVVRPGQVFDFWQALGEVSFRTGYRLGGAIIGGHSVEGKALAGGICSASTTLFNAAARAGFEIITRAPHWYYIPRYPLGLDATVSGAQSMRFRNDTAYPILIRGLASPGVVTFEIWSVPNGRTVSWSRPSVSNFVKGFDTVQQSGSLPRGQQQRIEWPANGMDVVVTRTVRNANGSVVHFDTFVSHYHRMVGITLVGR